MAIQANTTKKLTFADLTKLPIGDLVPHLKKIVRVDAAIAKAKDAFVASLQFNAKCVAALKRAYVDRLNKREIPPDTTFKKYFEQNAGGSLPGRVEALASLFNALVLTLDANGKPMLSEECFDAAALDWLERANAIVSKAMKTHGDAWKTCDEVLDTVNALSKPGDALKKLKEIRERQKGSDKESPANGDAPLLTVGRAIEFLKAAIKTAGDLPEPEAFTLYVETIKLGDAWADSGVAGEMLLAWQDKLDAATRAGVAPHLTVVKPETEPAAPAQTPNAPEKKSKKQKAKVVHDLSELSAPAETPAAPVAVPAETTAAVAA